MADESSDPGRRWRARPVLAGTLRAVLLAVPLVASTVAVLVVSRLLPPGAGRTWWGLATLLVTALAVAVAMERGTRRLLPIALLLKLSMIFPDRAPSRLKLARSAAVRTPRTELLWSGTEAEPTSTSELVLNLVAALGTHDRRTRGHSERVRLLCDMLAEELKLDAEARDRLRWAALLHDVGKMKVSTAILNKPGRLDAREFDRIKQHPAAGAELAAPLLPWLGEWGDGILDHHEKYDGSGYPGGKAGHEISAAGRLIGLIDAFETMTAARPYKKAMATKAAREELARCAGTHFDPLMVRAFLAISLPRVLWAMGPLSFVFQLPFLRPLADAGARAGATAPQAAAAALTSGAAGAAVIVSGTLGAAVAHGSTGLADLDSANRAAAPHSLQDRAPRTTPLRPVDPVTQLVPAPQGEADDAGSAPAPVAPAADDAGPGDQAGPAGAAQQPQRPDAPPAEQPQGSTEQPQPAEPPGPVEQPAPEQPAPEQPAPAQPPAPVEEPQPEPGEPDPDEPEPEPGEAPPPVDAPAPVDAPTTVDLPGPVDDDEPAAPGEQPGSDPVAPPLPPPAVEEPADGVPADEQPVVDEPVVEQPPPPAAPAPVGILSGPVGEVDSRTAVFTFAGGTTYECQVLANGEGGGSSYQPCSSPHTVTVLKNGSHTLNVRDRGTSGAVYSWTWTVVEPTVAAQAAVDPVPLAVGVPATPAGPHPGLPLMALAMALAAPVAAAVRRLRERRS